MKRGMFSFLMVFVVLAVFASFSASAYNPAYNLTVDPVLQWNTFLGGSSTDNGNGIAIDGSGNIYVTGFSKSTWGSPVNPFGGGNYDAFLAKLDSNGILQ